MPRLTFVVKGREVTSREIREKRGFDATLLVTLQKESVWETSDSNLRNVQEWFGENPPLIPGQGYPDGTCLVFSLHERGSNRITQAQERVCDC